MNRHSALASTKSTDPKASALKRLCFRYASRWRNLRYHLRTAEWETLREYQHSWRGSRQLPWLSLLRASWQHGASFADYYRYRFFEKTPEQRRSYITTSLRHELTRQLNDPISAEQLKDKACFKQHFADLLGREIWSWPELQQLDPAAEPPRLVLKPRWGQQGEGMLFPDNFASWAQAHHWIQARLQDPDRYVFEAYVVQHPDLAALNPSSLNTLRVVTCLQADQVELWALALRVGTRPGTDNFSNGGLGLEISPDGVLLPPAVKKNPFAPPCQAHPVSGLAFSGFRLPCWEAVLELARQSALRLPQVRSVGWDIAIRPEGPCLIEGNDNWGAHIAQIPQGRGLRHLAAAVCDMYQVYD